MGASDDLGTDRRDDDVVTNFSNRGSLERTPDLVAPGRSIQSLRNPGSYIDEAYPSGRVATSDGSDPRYFRGSGTSQSAAFVSGVVALLLQQRPELERVVLERSQLVRALVERRHVERALVERPRLERPELERCALVRAQLERPQLVEQQLERQPLVLMPGPENRVGGRLGPPSCRVRGTGRA